MPDGSLSSTPMPKSLRQPLQPTPASPLISIEAMGRHLNEVLRQVSWVDKIREEVGDEEKPVKPGVPQLTKAILRQRHVAHVDKRLWQHKEAVVGLILASRPETLADAMVQLMVAASDQAKPPAAQTKIIMQNCVRVIAKASGVPLAEVSGREYAGCWAEKWPDLDIPPGHSDDDSEIYRQCFDGSVP